MSVLEVRGLTRTFDTDEGKVEAVRGIDLTMESGEIVGFLGRNGAGKTTTMRMLTTLLTPTSGSAVVAGDDILSNPTGVRHHIGYVAQNGGADPTAKVGDELLMQGRLYRMSRAESEKRSREVAATLGLVDLWDQQTQNLSGGQRRRLEIAFGLLHRPTVLFLDEPTAGLDPPSRAQLWEYIRRLRREHDLTVFLTTHYLEEADSLCDRVLFIEQGRIVAEGTPDDLKSALAGDSVTVRVGSEPERAVAVLSQRDDVTASRMDGDEILLTVVHSEGMLVDIVRALDAAGLEPLAVSATRPSLESAFLQATGAPISEETEEEPEASSAYA